MAVEMQVLGDELAKAEAARTEAFAAESPAAVAAEAAAEGVAAAMAEAAVGVQQAVNELGGRWAAAYQELRTAGKGKGSSRASADQDEHSPFAHDSERWLLDNWHGKGKGK